MPALLIDSNFISPPFISLISLQVAQGMSDIENNLCSTLASSSDVQTFL